MCCLFSFVAFSLSWEGSYSGVTHTHTRSTERLLLLCVWNGSLYRERRCWGSRWWLSLSLSLSPTALGIKRRHRCFIFILLVPFVFPTSSSLLIFVSCAFVRIMKWNWEKNAQLIPPTPFSSYANAPPLCSSVKSQNRGSSTFLGLIWDDDNDDDRFLYPHSFETKPFLFYLQNSFFQKYDSRVMTTWPRKFIGMNRLSDFFSHCDKYKLWLWMGRRFFFHIFLFFWDPFLWFQPRACGALPSKLFFHWFEQQQQKMMEKKETEKNTNFIRSARVLFLRTNWSPPPPQSSGSPFSGFCPLVSSNVCVRPIHWRRRRRWR